MDGAGGPEIVQKAQGWGLSVETVHRVADASAVAWDGEADLVVAGFGGAGVAAALEAAERGVEVIALDRYEGGGSTAANGGIFYAGGGTKIQKEAGEEDTPEEMYKYLKLEVGEVVSDETLRRFCNESAETVDWILKHGGKLNSKVYKKKASYPPIDYFLFHPDSSLAAPYVKVAKPAARGHRAYTYNGKKAWGLGHAILFPMRDSAIRLGVEFHKYTEVRQLVQDASGRVIGVKAIQIPAGTVHAKRFSHYIARANWLMEMLPPTFPLASVTIALGRWYLAKAAKIEANHREVKFYRARHGVLLSSGGFVLNTPMLQHFAPKYVGAMPNGTLGDMGSGIILGASAGAKLHLMDRVSGWRFINPPKAWADGMMVNTKGERFVNESLYGASLGYAIIEEQNGKAWLVYDHALRKQAMRQAFTGGILPFQRDVTVLNLLFATDKAPTLDALAAKMGFDAATLKRTVEDYNRAARGEQEDRFLKLPADMVALGNGPFYATNMSADAPLYPVAAITMGGLQVDEWSGMVRDTSDKPIPGLYAAGRTAVGICSNIYVSGLSYADCFFSGRRVARHISGLKQGDDSPTRRGTQGNLHMR